MNLRSFYLFASGYVSKLIFKRRKVFSFPSSLSICVLTYHPTLAYVDISRERILIEADMHNLVPAVGELNADRSNYSFGIVNKKIKRYGACEFYIENRIVEPREEIKGDIARIYFYMIDRYSIKISKKEQQLFYYWNKIDKISIFERVRNQRIKNIQGNSNRFVENFQIK